MAVSSKNFLTGLNGDTKVLVGTDADAEKLEQAISMPAGEALVLTDANKTVKITSDRNVVTELARTYTVTGSVTATGHEYSGKEDSYGNLSSSRNSMMCYVRGVEIVRTSTESNPGKHSLKVRCEYMTNRATFVPFYLPIGPQGSETVDLTVSSEGDFTLVHLSNYASNVRVLKYNGHNYATFRVVKEEEGENGFEFTFHLVFDKVFGHEYTEEGYGDYLEVSVVISRSAEKNVSITKTEKLVVDASPEAFEKVTVAHSQQYKDEYFTKLFPGGQLAFQNPDTGSGEYVSVSFPERSGTVAVADSDGRLGVDVETAMMTETAKSVDGYPEYSEENPYAAGAVVVHDGKLWKCKDGIESGEAWNGSHWTETSVKVMLDSKLGKEGGSLTGPLSVGSVQIHGEGVNFNGYEIEFPFHTGTLALSSEVDSKLDAKNGVANGMVKIASDTDNPNLKPRLVFKTDFPNGSGSQRDDANISAGYDAEGNKLFLEFHGGENNEWDSRLTPDGTPVMTQSMVSSAIQGKFDTAGAANTAVTNHLSDGNRLHVTASEKKTWNEKAEAADGDIDLNSTKAEFYQLNEGEWYKVGEVSYDEESAGWGTYLGKITLNSITGAFTLNKDDGSTQDISDYIITDDNIRVQMLVVRKKDTSKAADSAKLGGVAASSYALASSVPTAVSQLTDAGDYLKKSGGTMTGTLTVSKSDGMFFRAERDQGSGEYISVGIEYNGDLYAPYISSSVGDFEFPTTSGTLALTTDIKTKTSELTNDSGFVTADAIPVKDNIANSSSKIDADCTVYVKGGNSWTRTAPSSLKYTYIGFAGGWYSWRSGTDTKNMVQYQPSSGSVYYTIDGSTYATTTDSGLDPTSATSFTSRQVTVRINGVDHKLSFTAVGGWESNDRLARDSEVVKASEVAVSKTPSGTTVTLTDRDCASVTYSSGLTLAFTDATHLRQFEILIKSCTASGSIAVPSKTYRGDSAAFTLEEGDNHISFAEQADGSFLVHRTLANTITIGG